MRNRLPAFAIYITMEFVSSLFFSLIFTVNMIYQVTVVHLNPLQLVLVGTTLEVTIFLFEIPTGVLADVKSRRLSVIIGYVLLGVGFVMEGSLPHFWTVALAQGIWGIGFTFTSGATQAWIADEIGPERAGQAFLRGAQAGQVGTLLAIPFSVALGRGHITLPIILGGVGMMLLAAFLATAMPERGFTPSRGKDRTTFGHMLQTVRDARQMTRRQPVLLTLLGIGLFFGMYSEGVDRLWTPHLLQDFATPWGSASEPVIWFGIIRGVLLVIAIAGTEFARRRVDTSRSSSLARVLTANTALIVIALAGFALVRDFWVAVALFWMLGALRRVRGPLYDAWFNGQIDDPQVRATMFSVSSQVDAIGQICGGPAVGAIGTAVSIRAALVASAAILAPAIPLHGLNREAPRDAKEDKENPSIPSS